MLLDERGVLLDRGLVLGEPRRALVFADRKLESFFEHARHVEVKLSRATHEVAPDRKVGRRLPDPCGVTRHAHTLCACWIHDNRSTASARSIATRPPVARAMGRARASRSRTPTGSTR